MVPVASIYTSTFGKDSINSMKIVLEVKLILLFRILSMSVKMKDLIY